MKQAFAVVDTPGGPRVMDRRVAEHVPWPIVSWHRYRCPAEDAAEAARRRARKSAVCEFCGGGFDAARPNEGWTRDYHAECREATLGVVDLGETDAVLEEWRRRTYGS